MKTDAGGAGRLNVNARRLTSREVATIRAALRLWIETPAHGIPDRCYHEIDGAAGVVSDDLVEALLHELAVGIVDVWVAGPGWTLLFRPALTRAEPVGVTRGERPPAPIDVRD